MVSFPASLDSLANPTNTTRTNDVGFEHHTQHANANDILEALEAKLGTGASTAAASTVLRGNGTGASVWGQIDYAYLATNGITQRVSAAASSVSTTSTSMVQISGTGTGSMTTTGGPVLLCASLLAMTSTAAAFGNVQIFQDGSLLANVVFDDLTTSRRTVSFVTTVTPSAGSHSWDLRWAATSGSTLAAAGAVIIATEFKR